MIIRFFVLFTNSLKLGSKGNEFVYNTTRPNRYTINNKQNELMTNNNNDYY